MTEAVGGDHSDWHEFAREVGGAVVKGAYYALEASPILFRASELRKRFKGITLPSLDPTTESFLKGFSLALPLAALGAGAAVLFEIKSTPDPSEYHS